MNPPNNASWDNLGQYSELGTSISSTPLGFRVDLAESTETDLYDDSEGRAGFYLDLSNAGDETLSKQIRGCHAYPYLELF